MEFSVGSALTSRSPAGPWVAAILCGVDLARSHVNPSVMWVAMDRSLPFESDVVAVF
jgi:hypothetical protein